MASRLYFGGAIASARYAATRPTLSAEVSTVIFNYLEKKIKRPFQLAIDVGCGSGQFTQPLATDFKKVIGFDASETQIEQAIDAKKVDNVEYGVSPAESLPVDAASVDLVLAVTAAHWFDYPKFCKEVDRVLRPGGCFVVTSCLEDKFCHKSSEISEKLNDILENLVEGPDQLGPHWPMTRTEMRAFYNNLTMLDYPDQERSNHLRTRKTMTLDDYIELCKTHSGSFVCLERHPDTDIYEKFRERILCTLGFLPDTNPAGVSVTVEWPMRMMLARKPGGTEN